MKDYLFSFLQRRNPETPSTLDADQFFIRLSSSLAAVTHYFSNLSSRTYRELRSELKSRGSSFIDGLDRAELLERYQELHELYRLINQEDMRQSFDGLDGLELEPQPLTSDDRILLWDHLAHYLWVFPDEIVVRDITSIFIAQKFWDSYQAALDASTDGLLTVHDTQALQRIARHAKVVISIPITRRYGEQNQLDLSRFQKHLLKQAQEGIVQIVDLNRLAVLARTVASTSHEIHQEKLATAAENAESTTRLITDNLSGIAVDIDERELRPLITRLTADTPPVTRHEISRKLAPEDAAFLDQQFHLKASDESGAQLQKRIDARLLTPLPVVQSSLVESIHFDGMTMNTEQSIPEGSFVLRAFELTTGKFDYYLTYYWGEKTSYRVVRLSGSLTINNQIQNFDLLEAEEGTHGFQHYKLTRAPISSTRSTLNARASLRFSVVHNPEEQIILPSADVVSVEPLMSRLAIDASTQDQTQQPEQTLGVESFEVADFRRVEQEVACYIPAEVSRIENILASEYKEKSTRNLLFTETETEIAEEHINEFLSDTAIAEKHAMQSEVSSTLDEESSRAFDFSTGVQGGFGPSLSFSADAGASFNNSSSKSQANSQALSYSQEVTRKIQEKIIQKRSSKRRSLTRKEYEESHKHGFDNKDGQEHVVGIYRYVDLIMDNSLVNYGKRLMFSMYIPEPAINYIWSKLSKALVGVLSQEALTIPETPETLGLPDIESLTEDNYYQIASAYRVDVPSPPPSMVMVSRGFSREIKGEGEIDTDHSASYNELEVPEGYQATHVYLSGAWDKHGNVDDESKLTISVGSYVISFDSLEGVYGNKIVADSDDLDDGEGIIPLSVTSNDVGAYSVNVSLECTLKDDRLFNEWRLETYNQILDAYESRKAAYLEEKKRRERDNQQQLDFKQSPAANRAIEKRELKLSCIKRLTEPFGLGISEQHYLVDVLPPKIIPSEKLEEHTRLAEFLENAFDWNLMAYNFYPYYYLHQNLWYWRMEVDGVKDPLFESFLTAGFAKLLIPVKRGFETEVMYFMETGEVWKNPDFVLDVKDDLYVAAADEMATADEEIKIEDSWQTKLPTGLTILQKRAAGLDEEGLPCKDGMNPIAMGNSILQPGGSSDN